MTRRAARASESRHPDAVGEGGDTRPTRHQRLEAVRVRTENASSNAPMLAINDTLGFKIINTRTEWQAEARELLRALR